MSGLMNGSRKFRRLREHVRKGRRRQLIAILAVREKEKKKKEMRMQIGRATCLREMWNRGISARTRKPVNEIEIRAAPSVTRLPIGAALVFILLYANTNNDRTHFCDTRRCAETNLSSRRDKKYSPIRAHVALVIYTRPVGCRARELSRADAFLQMRRVS